MLAGEDAKGLNPLHYITGADMVQRDDGEWISVSEAARRLGVTRQTIQYRIKKGQVEFRHDNRGNPTILFAAETKHSAQSSPSAESADICADASAPRSPSLVSLDDVRNLLSEQAERLQKAHHEAMSLMIERVDAAEIRSERVEQRLDQVLDQLLADRRQPVANQVEQGDRLPWWRRWFGRSTKSDLGRG